jgi:PAS domain S-box-containing protein
MLAIKHTSPLLRYGVAVLAVGMAFLVKLLLNPLIVQETPFLLIFGAIMISAWYGGLGPGLLATVAAGLATDYFFLQPTSSFSGFSLETVPLLAFFLEGTLVCLLVEALRAARSRAEGSTLEAERQREHLRRNEEHFRSLVEGMRDYAIFTLDPQGCVASWNAGAERLEGYNSEEIVGEHFSVFFTEVDTKLGKPEEHLEAASEGRSVEENWLVRKDGSRFWADTILTASHDDEGKLRSFSVVTQDITEKKEAERNLKEAEDRLRTLVEHVPAITYTGEVGGDRALAYVSPQIEEVLGYSPGEVMADPDHWTKMLHPHDKRWVLAEDRRTGETGGPLALEYRMFARNGRVVWLRDEATLVRDEEGNPLHWQGFMLDITKRKKAEERLRESEELYRNVVEQAAENIFLVDPYTKHILQANASFHHSLGYEAEELRRLTLSDIVAHDHVSIDRNVQRVLDEGRLSIGERRYRRKDGSLINVEVSAGAIAYGGRPALCVVAHDVTQRKMAEEALRRSLDALLALYETGQILSSSLEREEIGSRLLQVVRRVSNLTAAVISIPDENGELSIWRSSGLDGLWRQARFAPEALSARREVLESREHRLLRLRRPEDDPRGRHLVSLYLPLLVRDRIVGVLEAYGPEALGEEGSETLISLANQAASALENARLYAELTERENQLRRLVGKLITAQEEERRRVAHDVHDGLAQTAAAAHQHLQAFARHNPPGSPRGQEELDETLQLVREVVGEARGVIHDLRPTVLDDFGLAAAIRLQVQMLRSEGLEVGLQEALGDERLPPEVETTLFRVAQEALTNVRKHARAAAVHVVLDRSGRAVRLMVRDEGRGFRPDEATRSNGPGERVGLSGMRERLSLLGGRFELQSEPGSGTTVTAEVEVPTNREDSDDAG